VRSFLVVFLAEPIEAGLLRRLIGGWGTGRFRFQRPVQPFVPSVLLRLTRGHALGLDPPLQPPHRQLRQATNRQGSKGDAVIGADRLGQSLLRKEPLPHRNDSAVAVEGKAWQTSKYRVCASVTVSG
jgi:hypothetical protein